jgi:hypothetical protein
MTENGLTAMFRALFDEAHDVWLELTMEDVTPEMATWQPPGRVVPIGALYAHALLAEDVGVGHVVGGRAPLVMSEYTGRAGMDSIPPLGKWDEWARSAAFDIDALRAYARAVYAQTDAVIVGLTPADLERTVDPAAVGLGVQSIQSLLMTIGTHTVVHSGEISAVKGMQDRKGYAF